MTWVSRQLEAGAGRAAFDQQLPDFTGRICLALRSRCTLGINAAPVGIKSIEHFIIDKGWEMGWSGPAAARHKTGKKVAIVGPDRLVWLPPNSWRGRHDVTVLRKNAASVVCLPTASPTSSWKIRGRPSRSPRWKPKVSFQDQGHRRRQGNASRHHQRCH